MHRNSYVNTQSSTTFFYPYPHPMPYADLRWLPCCYEAPSRLRVVLLPIGTATATFFFFFFGLFKVARTTTRNVWRVPPVMRMAVLPPSPLSPTFHLLREDADDEQRRERERKRRSSHEKSARYRCGASRRNHPTPRDGTRSLRRKLAKSVQRENEWQWK
jgi:hypothetical protein